MSIRIKLCEEEGMKGKYWLNKPPGLGHSWPKFPIKIHPSSQLIVLNSHLLPNSPGEKGFPTLV